MEGRRWLFGIEADSREKGGNNKIRISCHGFYVVSSIQIDISEGKASLSILFYR